MMVINSDGTTSTLSKRKIVDTLLADNAQMKTISPKKCIKQPMLDRIAMRIYDRCRKRSYATSTAEITELIDRELLKAKAYEMVKMRIKNRYGNDATGKEL